MFYGERVHLKTTFTIATFSAKMNREVNVMAIYLEMPELDKEFPFRILVNDGDILTTPHWHREVELI